MHGATLRDFQQSLLLLRRETMQKTNREGDLSNPMRPLGHHPFRVHRQSFPRDPMTRAEPSDKISHATRERSDKEVHRTHARIGAAVFNRLIRDDRMLAGRNIEPAAAMMNNGEGHKEVLNADTVVLVRVACQYAFERETAARRRRMRGLSEHSVSGHSAGMRNITTGISIQAVPFCYRPCQNRYSPPIETILSLKSRKALVEFRCVR